MDLSKLQEELRAFAAERDWDQFHSPKNLSMALAVEAAEVLELFQWLSEAETSSLPELKVQQVAHEIADVQIYLARLADVLNIDIEHSVREKLALNETKYPVEKAKGNAKKYNELDRD